MAIRPLPDFSQNDPCEPDPYDRETVKPDLWFLPPADEAAPDLVPLPRADRRPLFDPREWAAAQSALSARLTAVAVQFGALDERLRAAPDGFRHRLALLEVAELSWWAGDRISAERLALWAALHLAGVQDDSQGLARAAWALRRLSGGPGPGADRDALAGFLGRQGSDAAAPEGVADLAALADSLAHLHPVTRAAALFHGWRMLGQDRSGPVEATRDIEAAVLASRVASGMGRGAALFLPLAIAGFTGGRGGPVRDRLAAWLRGAERATLAALLHLDRVALWTRRAEAELADLQGRTPGLLIRVLAEWPIITARVAERFTGPGRATVLRARPGLDAIARADPRDHRPAALSGLDRPIVGRDCGFLGNPRDFCLMRGADCRQARSIRPADRTPARQSRG